MFRSSIAWSKTGHAAPSQSAALPEKNGRDAGHKDELGDGALRLMTGISSGLGLELGAQEFAHGNRNAVADERSNQDGQRND